jgi:hypothetical protein
MNATGMAKSSKGYTATWTDGVAEISVTRRTEDEAAHALATAIADHLAVLGETGPELSERDSHAPLTAMADVAPPDELERRRAASAARLRQDENDGALGEGQTHPVDDDAPVAFEAPEPLITLTSAERAEAARPMPTYDPRLDDERLVDYARVNEPQILNRTKVGKTWVWNKGPRLLKLPGNMT